MDTVLCLVPRRPEGYCWMRRSFVLTTRLDNLGVDHDHRTISSHSSTAATAATAPLHVISYFPVLPSHPTHPTFLFSTTNPTTHPWFPRPETHSSMTRPQTRQQQNLCYFLLQRPCPPRMTSSMHSQSLYTTTTTVVSCPHLPLAIAHHHRLIQGAA